jgi:hypothetical protein
MRNIPSIPATIEATLATEVAPIACHHPSFILRRGTKLSTKTIGIRLKPKE